LRPHEEYVFVHAGLRPRIPIAEQSPEDLLWIRHEFIESDSDFGRTVVFGHTPFPEPLLEKNKIGIVWRHGPGGKARHIVITMHLPHRIKVRSVDTRHKAC
jgi:hypothetical protein